MAAVSPEAKARQKESHRLWRLAHPDYNRLYKQANRQSITKKERGYKQKWLEKRKHQIQMVSRICVCGGSFDAQVCFARSIYGECFCSDRCRQLAKEGVCEWISDLLRRSSPA